MSQIKKTLINSEEHAQPQCDTTDVKSPLKFKSKPDPFEMERKLLPRLRFMSFVFFGLCLISFVYACFVHTEKTPSAPLIIDENSILSDIEFLSGTILFTDMAPLEVAPEEIFNFYAVSLIFGSIGVSLFYFFQKRTKNF